MLSSVTTSRSLAQEIMYPSLFRPAGIRDLASKLAYFLETFADITQDRQRSGRTMLRVAQHCNGEFDRYAAPVFGQAGNRQQVAMSIAAFTGRHGMTIASPVPAPQIFRDDQIERPSGGFHGGKAKNPLRAGTPERDQAFAVGRDDGVRRRREQCGAEIVRSGHAL